MPHDVFSDAYGAGALRGEAVVSQVLKELREHNVPREFFVNYLRGFSAMVDMQVVSLTPER